MTTTTATAPKTQIATGETRDFPVAGGHKICVQKTGTDAYRVVVLRPNGLALTHFTTVFDTALGNVPLGISARRAAWNYIQHVTAELAADAERPTDVAARTATEYAIADLARLTNAQQTALATADPTGLIRHGNGVVIPTLRALARQHLGRLVYTTTGMRRSVVGVQLNTHGRRLAEHVQTINATAVAA